MPECHADTALVRYLLNDDPRIDHASGMSSVGVTMREAPADSILIGFVDDDKRVPPYFDDFELISTSHNVLYKKKRNQERYLIVLHKAVETFLIWNAEETQVDLALFGFEKDVKRLGRKLKSVQMDTSPEYQALLKELDQKNAPGLVRIRALINEILHE